MRYGTLCLVTALAVALFLGERGAAQPPGKRGRPGGGSIERAVDKMKLSSKAKETVKDAIVAYQDNVRRLTDLASAGLLLKVQEVVSHEEFATLRKATEKSRTGPGGPGGPRARRALGGDDMAERILSFDKNKDGKVSKDELPERLQYLIAKGDTNKDGVLDKDEIKKLAADQPRDVSPRGRGGPGGPRGRGGPGGPGTRGVPGGGLTPGAVERALAGLKLSGSKKEAALAAVKACQEDVRKLTALARADLLLRAGDVLEPTDLKKLTEAIDRQPSGGDRRPPLRRPPGR